MTGLGLRLFVVAFLGLAAATASNAQKFEYDEDAELSVTSLIKKYGYHGETHHATTADGYILELHRITGSNKNSSPKGKQPILILHSLLSSSADWIITGPGQAFGYILADEGYDVWLGNFRGNSFSREHTHLSAIDSEFWKFSWHENGVQDLPAMIDYVLETTNNTQLVYAGHSEGTTAFWVMATERPEYQDKVKVMFAMGPIAYVSHAKSPFYKFVAKYATTAEKIVSLLGMNELGPSSDILRKIAALICRSEMWTQPLCTNIIFLIAGPSYDQLNKTMLPAILGHVPAGGSVRQVVHYLQVLKDDKFQQYDYGKIGNLLKYHRLHPPRYDLSKIRVPVSLHYAENDYLATPKDVKRLHKELGNSIGLFRVPYDKFSHLDFLWAIDGKKLLYDKIIGLMRLYRD